MENATWKPTSASATSVTPGRIAPATASAHATAATTATVRLVNAYAEKAGKVMRARSSLAPRDVLGMENVSRVCALATKVTEDPSAACVTWFTAHAIPSPKIANANLCALRKLVSKVKCG